MGDFFTGTQPVMWSLNATDTKPKSVADWLFKPADFPMVRLVVEALSF